MDNRFYQDKVNIQNRQADDLQRAQDNQLFDKIRAGHAGLLNSAEMRQIVIEDQDAALELQRKEHEDRNNQQQEEGLNHGTY